MTLAVEPMINAGTPDVLWMDDEWTVITEDMSLSAHYENTILITNGKPEILSLTEEEKEAMRTGWVMRLPAFQKSRTKQMP